MAFHHEPIRLYLTRMFVDALWDSRPEHMTREMFDKWVKDNVVIVEPMPEE